MNLLLQIYITFQNSTAYSLEDVAKQIKNSDMCKIVNKEYTHKYRISGWLVLYL